VSGTKRLLLARTTVQEREGEKERRREGEKDTRREKARRGR
jgi:hypothetical protein